MLINSLFIIAFTVDVNNDVLKCIVGYLFLFVIIHIRVIIKEVLRIWLSIIGPFGYCKGSTS